MTAQTINAISTNDALILQQIAETGEGSLEELMYDMHMSQGRLYELVERLKQKGFVNIKYYFDDILVSLSSQGNSALKQLWPEQQYAREI